MSVHPICTICNSQETSYLFTSYNKHGRHTINRSDTFELYSCQQCANIFIGNIKVSKKYFETYYQNDYYEDKLIQSAGILRSAIALLEHVSLARKQKNILKYAPSRTSRINLLDIGCGSGTFLDFLDKETFRTFGVEIHDEGYKKCLSKGLEVYNKEIHQIDFKQKFDVITLWHVLEHLEDPRSVCKKIAKLLKKDGILILATPNHASLGFHLGKENWFHLDSPRHLNICNHKTLENLLRELGFYIETEIKEPYDYPLDLFWSLQHSFFKYFIYPLYPVVKIFDKETLTVVCKKLK